MHTTNTARRLVLCCLSLLMAVACSRCPSALAERFQADDPFADELNPFGTGKSPPAKPATKPTEPAAKPAVEPLPRELPRPAERPRPQLPVPFPDAAGPGEPAGKQDRPAVRDVRPLPGDEGRGPRRGPADEPREDRGSDAEESGEPGERAPSEAERKFAEAERLEQQGKLEEARDLLREVVKLDPSLPLGHLALGVVLRELGDFRGSIDACTRGIEADPEQPELYLRRGIGWFHLDLHGIALEDFEEAAGLAFDDPRPELWRGLTLMQMGRPFEAINAYASAIRRDRSFMLAYLNRGLAYLATDEPRKAELDFNQAIRQQPKDSRAWFNRGVAQARQGRYREAIESYETALGISPDDGAARQNLDAARSMVGREPQSRR